jgi:protein-disulfide isomerase
MGPIVVGRVAILPFLLLVGACGSAERVPPTRSEPEATVNDGGETHGEGERRATDQPGCNRGNPNAPIRLEVFSDYECPSCRAFYLQTMKQIFTDYADTGKVCVVYREYPTYPHSREAARFARAALRVGPAQWGRVVEALYQSQPEWSPAGSIEAVVASALGAEDLAAVREHLQDPSLDTVIDEDAIIGLQRGVQGTPTSFITVGGQTEKVDGALTYAGMQRRLDGLP